MLETEAAKIFDVERPFSIAGRPLGAGGDAPFVIEHRREEYDLAGTFRPSARLVLTDRVRTSGLWRALTPEDAKTLILLLTFVTPNGWCRPTLPELADAMGASQAKAGGRLDRLLTARWRGHPLASLLPRPDGLDAYLPGKQLVAHEETTLPQAPRAAPPQAAGKEAVVAHSRARYAKTREEVEAQIAGMMGWVPPEFAGEDPAVAEGKRKAYKAMTDLGVPKDQALDLLARFDLGDVEKQIGWLPSRGAKNPARFDLGDVEKQIGWLPSRGAKNPARFLAAAIEGGYDRPLALRQQSGEVGEAQGQTPPGQALGDE